jgi:hypothetical protein
VIGTTARRDTGPAEGPVLHSVSWAPERASRTGVNYRARCGASVRDLSGAPFDPKHPRACPKCRRIGLG